MSLAQNKILRGRYQIHSSLGRGGFGEVYKAKDLHKQELVAVKETLDSQSIHAFNIEFAILQQVRHPNLPRYYEVFEENGRGYLVMELIPGQSLRQVIDSQRGHPLIESQVIGGYAIQVCDALAYLHSQRPPILHRDIKTENIRLTPEGLVKLVDFGLIKQGTGRTQTLMRGLTPLYAPIEQYGVVTQLHTDERSDVYSLGATLFYLLTAQEPVPVLDRLNEVNSNRGDPQPAPQSVNPRVSPSVSQAIYVAMAIKQNQCSVANIKQ